MKDRKLNPEEGHTMRLREEDQALYYLVELLNSQKLTGVLLPYELCLGNFLF